MLTSDPDQYLKYDITALPAEKQCLV